MYFSVDVETDGDVPGVSSMLSIGVVALDPRSPTLSHLSSFYQTLRRLPDARPLNTTMEWWDQFPESWVATRKNPMDPKEAMEALRTWVRDCVDDMKRAEGDAVMIIPVFVAKPVGFDFMWVNYYFHRFLGANPFGLATLDMGSMAMGLTGMEGALRSSSWPQGWTEGLEKNDHHALHDAENQAEIFRRMMRHQPDRASKETA